MRNPFRSEAEAFRLVWLSLVYFALIVVAAAIATWFGLVVFLVLTAVAIWLIRGGRREPPRRVRVESAGIEGERRILGRQRDRRRGRAAGADRATKRRRPGGHPGRLPGAELTSSPLGLGRGLGRGAGPAPRQHRQARRRRRERPRRDRGCRSAPGDGGCDADVRRGRDRHLDAPARPLALAGAGDRRWRAPALRGCTTWSSTSRRNRARPPDGGALLPGGAGDVLRDGGDLRLAQQAVLERGHRALRSSPSGRRAPRSASRHPGSAPRCRSSPRPRACGTSRSRHWRRAPCRRCRRLPARGRASLPPRPRHGPRTPRRRPPPRPGPRRSLPGALIGALREGLVDAGHSLHARRGILDRVLNLVAHHLPHGRLGHAGARAAETVVQVGPDHALRPGRGERVARAAPATNSSSPRVVLAGPSL